MGRKNPNRENLVRAEEDAVKEYADKLTALIFDPELGEQFASFGEALKHVYQQQADNLQEIFVSAPQINFSKREKKYKELELKEWIKAQIYS